ncbi:uncharacterized protein LOC114575132 [Exaiptasia diaphana]|uniref:Anoctamin dimerisation domain-containing protein n=1 Tax=Exaiptasia diaphana TaxID=2652724 RepID=A0A913YL07_EXADI|nr:uncharacterized protein LOC114575132 [Exaiptasia diaphana]
MDEQKHSPSISKDSDVLLEMEPRNTDGDASNFGLQFNDGAKDIHYILVYERCEETENKDENSKAKAENNEKERENFEKEIVSEGLEIERRTIELPGVSFIASFKIITVIP